MEIQAIKNYMKEHKITYDELAQRTGLSKSCITKIFGGYAKYPRVDTMQAIERALGLAPTFTEEEIAQGIGHHPIALSDRASNWLATLYRADDVLGESYVNAIMNMIDLNVEKQLQQKGK